MLLTPTTAILVVSGVIGVYLLAYVVYQRLFHPLARYPGPFLASLTDFWQARQVLSLKQPYSLTKLHEKYGPVVRYGPDNVSITLEEAVPVIYPAASRSLPKTEYYDAFGGAHPNIFGTRDEVHHATRRRHMSHAFSMASIKDMEQYMDENIAILKSEISRFCRTGQAFDLKELLHNYVIDVLGELAFSQSFELQKTGDRSRVPPVKEHTLLGTTMGSLPGMIPWLKWILPKLPVSSIQELFQGRLKCAQLAASCVRRRLDSVKSEVNTGDTSVKNRKDLLTTLIRAKDPETGAKLTQTDLETEAFGFIIAGTHTTMATTTLVLHHLLHNPRSLEKVTEEIFDKLEPLSSDQSAYPITNLEAKLPYLRLCMQENYRLTPIFTMPLARRVTAAAGLSVPGTPYHFPQGTSVAICNHALHHNPEIWGPDHNNFDPSRWDNPDTAAKSRILMHFGLGGRQCIGKTMATTNITKVVSTLIREFEFEIADETRRAEVAAGEWVGRLPALISVGVSDLDGGLWVTARSRSKTSAI